MTIFSPNTVATLATRTSTSLPSITVENWPSCGRRFSTMFMPLMIFKRLVSAACTPIGRENVSTRWPSMRNRTRTFSSIGSMWMSLARSRIAWLTTRFTSWMTGA